MFLKQQSGRNKMKNNYLDIGRKLFRPTRLKKILFFLLTDIVVFTVSLYLAMWIRFEFAVPVVFSASIMIPWLMVFMGIKISLLALSRVYNFTWRFIGLHELYIIMKALTISFFILS